MSVELIMQSLGWNGTLFPCGSFHPLQHRVALILGVNCSTLQDEPYTLFAEEAAAFQPEPKVLAEGHKSLRSMFQQFLFVRSFSWSTYCGDWFGSKMQMRDKPLWVVVCFDNVRHQMKPSSDGLTGSTASGRELF
eukprot:3030984-Amphidinium_carterae.1